MCMYNIYESYKSKVITIFYEINKVTRLTFITISKYLLRIVVCLLNSIKLFLLKYSTLF